MNRRDLYRFGTIALGGAVAFALAVPGVAYLLDPLRKGSKKGDFQSLTKLRSLKPGEPRSFAVLDEHRDAWVRYPREPIGSVWLVRQALGAKPEVIAFTSECPHLGCAVNLTAEGTSFLCPCHTSAFGLDGHQKNEIPPRGMDTLEVELSLGDDPDVLVKFQRFRTSEKEKTPLV